MPHRTRSDYTLSHVNREEAPGRDRAWTTTDVRPRVGPVSARPGLSPAIEIVQTSPTPTDGPSPVFQNIREADRRHVRDAIYVDGEHASVTMWEGQSSRKSERSDRPSTAPGGPLRRSELPSKRARDASASPRVYQSSLPGVPEVHVPDTYSIAAPHLQYTTISPLDSTSSLEIDIGEPLTRVTTEPLGSTPSAVDLHNLHFAGSRDLENFSHIPHGAHLDNGRAHGLDSTRDVNADKSWRVLGLEEPSPLTDTSKPSPTRSGKITGFLSRLKR
jgi:hypothetical protein